MVRGNKNNNSNKKWKPKRGYNSGGKGPAGQSAIEQPRMKPVVHFSRTVTGIYDINCDGINPSLGYFVFNLNSLPDPQDFTNLFQSYKLMKIQINFKPEYTELTDAALVSNAINVNFNSVIDQTDPNPPTTVDAVTQFQSCKSTGITKEHKRTFKPTMLTSSQMPCSCFISTQNPTERHYGFKYGIPPTGVAMIFRSTVTIWFTCAGAR